MDNSFHTSNRHQRISSVRLVYGNPPVYTEDPLETIDYCTRLIMQVREDQLLYNMDPEKYIEQYEMDHLGYVAVEEDEEE